jgi:hypothetical protein
VSDLSGQVRDAPERYAATVAYAKVLAKENL